MKAKSYTKNKVHNLLKSFVYISFSRVVLLLILAMVLFSTHFADAQKHRAKFVDWDGTLTTGKSVETEDSLALVAFYESMNGDTWVDNSGWLEDPVEFWVGVRRVVNVGDEENPEWRVDWFTFPYYNMTELGELPSEIGNMKYLRSLTVKMNLLTGKIPDTIGKMERLQALRLRYNHSLGGDIPWDELAKTNIQVLRLWGNEFTGTIPPEIKNLESLQILDLQGNNLTGEIPEELGKLTNLIRFQTANNFITGDVPNLSGLRELETLDIGEPNLNPQPIPDWIQELPNLRALRLIHGPWTGPMPEWIGDMTTLREIYLGRDHLEGPIPDLSNLTNLQRFTIRDTGLSGGFPESLLFLPNLRQLDLAGVSITGTLPDEVGYLPNLRILQIIETELEGDIPESLQEASNLRRMDIHTNPNMSVTEIPSWIQNLTSLERIRLSAMGIEGEIPDFFGNLENLRRLQLQDNHLTGTIPSNIANLSNLTHLHLQGNLLEGSIPDLSSAEILAFLDLSDNQLEVGNLPTWIFELSQLEHLYLNDVGVTGEIPTWIGAMNRLRQLGLSRNELIGEIPSTLQNRADDDAWYFTQLHLADNQLNGEIPDWLTKFDQLTALELGGNNFTEGSIPTFLAELDSLSYLGLGRTNRTGEIPGWVSEYRNLSTLALDGNQLTGQIPPSLGNVKLMDSLNLGYNQLSGEIPSELHGMGMGETGDLHTTMQAFIVSGNEDLTGSVPMFFTEWDTDPEIFSRPLLFRTGLRVFWFDETGLCEPEDQAFHDWLDAILEHPAVDLFGDDALTSVKRTGVICDPISAENLNDGLPARVHLYRNYPNPFNPTTTIQYDIPSDGVNVKLNIYNVLGQLVTTLVNEQKDAGQYQVIFDATSLSSGTYIYRLEAGDVTMNRTMILVK